jgi:hypothetical protein
VSHDEDRHAWVRSSPWRSQDRPPGRLQAQSPALGSRGRAVPKDASFKDIDGKDHSFGDYRGRSSSSISGRSSARPRRSPSRSSSTSRRAYGDKGSQIAISANQKEIAAALYANLRDHAQSAGVNFLIAVDPGNKLTDLLGGETTPHSFVFDKDGVLRYSGAPDDDPRGAKGAGATFYVRDAIEAALAGKPVAVATTKPYG